jgi:hypothetical protein
MASAALPVMQADFMAHAQMSAAAKVFTTPVANFFGVRAWTAWLVPSASTPARV